MMPSFEGNLLTQRHQSYLIRTRYSRLSHSEDFMILSCVVLTQYSSVTDRRTRLPLQRQKLHAVARKNQAQNIYSARLQMFCVAHVTTD